MRYYEKHISSLTFSLWTLRSCCFIILTLGDTAIPLCRRRKSRSRRQCQALPWLRWQTPLEHTCSPGLDWQCWASAKLPDSRSEALSTAARSVDSGSVQSQESLRPCAVAVTCINTVPYECGVGSVFFFGGKYAHFRKSGKHGSFKKDKQLTPILQCRDNHC